VSVRFTYLFAVIVGLPAKLQRLLAVSSGQLVQTKVDSGYLFPRPVLRLPDEDHQ